VREHPLTTNPLETRVPEFGWVTKTKAPLSAPSEFEQTSGLWFIEAQPATNAASSATARPYGNLNRSRFMDEMLCSGTSRRQS
jgi:hypothetical protein